MPRPKLKVCCIQSLEEARLAISLGADALGLVAEMPSGPGPIPDTLIRSIATRIPPPIATFLLTCRTTAPAILDHLAATACNTIQICDLPDVTVYAQIRHAAPAIRIVQVIHVQDEQSIEEALAAAPHVDALLLDSGRTRLPPGATIELGGTGRTHDWSLSTKIIQSTPTPVFLAGGLTPTNVQSALTTTHPYGLDLCNGVRTAGNLDEPKLRAFVAAMNMPAH